MSREKSLLVLTSLSAIALLATGFLLRADDPPAPTPPPGYKTVYKDLGDGHKMPVFVKDLPDPLRNDKGQYESDPLDHQKVFSETNALAHKSFLTGNGADWAKTSNLQKQDAFVTKVYDTTGPTSVYNLGSKSTFRTNAYNGTSAASGYNKNFATKTADVGQDQTATAFAAISPDQNLTAPIDAKPVDTFAAPMASKTFLGPEADAAHRHVKKLGTGQLLIEDIPNRPLTIDEVRDLINHGFQPDLNQAPPPASKPLNDPDYQPTPLRIDPSTVDGNPPAKSNKDDDDSDDPVPPPGTMAEPLPSK